MAQIDREWGEILREANAAQDEASLLTPGKYGDLLVALIRERVPLREEGPPAMPDIPPGANDFFGNPVTWSVPKGRRFSADRCPFCQQERPFHVFESAASWHCPECHRTGGAVEWVMVMDNLSGAEAVRQLKVRGWLTADS